MEEYRSGVNASAEDILKAIPTRLNCITTKLAELFPSTDPSSVYTTFTKYATSDAPINQEMANIVQIVRSILHQGVTDTAGLERWIALNVPKCEDGNNFGVDVQTHVGR